MHGDVGGDDLGLLGRSLEVGDGRLVLGGGLLRGDGVRDAIGVDTGLLCGGEVAVNLVGVVVGGPLLLGLVEGGLRLAAQEEAIGEEVVVDPVGPAGADGGDGDVVDQDHDGREDGKAQNAVGHDAVDLLRGGELLGGLLDAGVHDRGDPVVAVGGDDGLAVVVTVVLDGLDGLLGGCEDVLAEVQRLDGLGIALADLDGIPANELDRHP